MASNATSPKRSGAQRSGRTRAKPNASAAREAACRPASQIAAGFFDHRNLEIALGEIARGGNDAHRRRHAANHNTADPVFLKEIGKLAFRSGRSISACRRSGRQFARKQGRSARRPARHAARLRSLADQVAGASACRHRNSPARTSSSSRSPVCRAAARSVSAPDIVGRLRSSR